MYEKNCYQNYEKMFKGSLGLLALVVVVLATSYCFYLTIKHFLPMFINLLHQRIKKKTVIWFFIIFIYTFTVIIYNTKNIYLLIIVTTNIQCLKQLYLLKLHKNKQQPTGNTRHSIFHYCDVMIVNYHRSYCKRNFAQTLCSTNVFVDKFGPEKTLHRFKCLQVFD